MSSRHIPLSKATLVGEELHWVAEALKTGHLSGGGTFAHKCQLLLEERLGVPKVLLTTSCTHALEMCGLLLDLQPGDEVILPSFTFVSTANAFLLRGARVVFADVRPDTLNLDAARLEERITARTRAIVVVHYAGVACEMDRVLEIAGRYDIPVIEDNAHALFGKYQGKYLGTFGCLATQSFHETKNFTCGEGGALLINDPRYKGRAEIILEKGTNRSRFLRGQVDKYTWVDVGSSYVPADILAGFLYAQLLSCEKIQAERKRAWDFYYAHLSEWAQHHGVQLPTVPPTCEQAYALFYLLLPSLAVRQALSDHLKQNGIASAFHFLPLHLSLMGQRFGGKAGDCPVTEDVSDRLLRLPFFTAITEAEQEKVVAAVTRFQWPAEWRRTWRTVDVVPTGNVSA
jgi:dTDP-4-amino-4,6-dideoxygalactose transaminase